VPKAGRSWGAEILLQELTPGRECGLATPPVAVDPLVEISHRERAIAAWGQEEFERVLCHLARVVLGKTGSKRLVLGGGCAYNCAANGRIR
jgi:hypothetical protein